MLYISQDIARNIHNASRSGDKRLTRDIIGDEIAKMIVTKPSNVKKAILDAGIEIKKNDESALAKILIENIPINSKLRKNMTVLLMDSNGVSESMSFSGYMPKTNGKKMNDTSKQAGVVIYDAMHFAFDSDSKSESDEANKTLVNKIKTHISNFDVINGKDKVKLKKAIVITSIVTIGLMVGGYYLTRYIINRKKEKAQEALSQDDMQSIGINNQNQNGNDAQINIPNDGGVYDMSYVNNQNTNKI